MSARKTCDLYFSKIVRARGACERCGDGPPHEAAHIIRRRFVGDPDGVGLRWNEDNCWCLCIPCHRTVDTDPIAFTALVDQTIGLTKYLELMAVKAAQHRPWREADWIRERQRLAAILKGAS